MRKFFAFNPNQSTPTSKPPFGQKRAEQLNTRLDKAITERRKLARAEAAADDPLKTIYSHKSNLAERKINRLTAEIFNAKK